MVGDATKLAALEKIARLKAERELKKFAAFSVHMTIAQQHADAMRAALEQSFRSASPLSVAEARTANAQAGRSARELRRAEDDLARMRPGFNAARAAAAREFGRAEVLQDLTQAARDGHRRSDEGS